MNRHERRAAAARRSNRERHDTFYQQYIRHLPQVPAGSSPEPGHVYHLCFHHDDWCRFYDNENLGDCNCDVVITRHVEPRRS
jgi:hypothetical protein